MNELSAIAAHQQTAFQRFTRPNLPQLPYKASTSPKNLFRARGLYIHTAKVIQRAGNSINKNVKGYTLIPTNNSPKTPEEWLHRRRDKVYIFRREVILCLGGKQDVGGPKSFPRSLVRFWIADCSHYTSI